MNASRRICDFVGGREVGMPTFGAVRTVFAVFPRQKGLAQPSAGRENGDISLRHRFARAEGIHILRPEFGNGPGDRFQVIHQMDCLRFSSFAITDWSTIQGRFVIFARPASTGPATPKQARST